MAAAPKESAAGMSSASFLRNLFQARLYKRNQGRITRQVTFAAIAIAMLLGCWRLHLSADPTNVAMRIGLPGALLSIGLWVAYRMVNLAVFADFLISVEAEMSKVSWPTKTELVRGSMVVLITILFLAGFLFMFDLIWAMVFKYLGIVG
jgi:preprotein translocase subunit SecE